MTSVPSEPSANFYEAAENMECWKTAAHPVAAPEALQERINKNKS